MRICGYLFSFCVQINVIFILRQKTHVIDCYPIYISSNWIFAVTDSGIGSIKLEYGSKIIIVVAKQLLRITLLIIMPQIQFCSPSHRLSLITSALFVKNDTTKFQNIPSHALNFHSTQCTLTLSFRLYFASRCTISVAAPSHFRTVRTLSSNTHNAKITQTAALPPPSKDPQNCELFLYCRFHKCH
jgi:hypothetical protein